MYWNGTSIETGHLTKDFHVVKIHQGMFMKTSKAEKAK